MKAIKRSDFLGHLAVASTAAAVALGVFLRFYRLDWQSLWVDEIHTLGPALHASSLGDAFWNYINLAPSPPLYYLFIMAWTKVVGFSDWTLRLPSAVIGAVTIPIFWAGLSRTFDRPTTLVAVILMALSWPAIFYSQELRGYAAVLLFTTWAAVTWMAILEDFAGSRNSDWAQMTVASLLASMTHPFGFILSAFQFLYLFVVANSKRTHRVRSIVLGAVPVAAYAAWLSVNLVGIDWVLGKQNMYERPGLGFLVDVGAFLFHHPIPAVLSAVIPLALGAVAYARRLRVAIGLCHLSDPVIYLPFMLAAPFAFAFLVAQVQPFLYSRYLIPFLPFIFAFIAVVLSARPWRDRATPVLLAFALATTSLFWILRDYYEVDKEQVRELGRYVRTVVGPNDAIVTGCETKAPFECALGPGRRTDADWSKYLYYLNYESLPSLTMIPDVFHDQTELDTLFDLYRRDGKERVILMGSRRGFGYIEDALPHIKARGYACEVKQFHSAAVALCPLS